MEKNGNTLQAYGLSYQDQLARATDKIDIALMCGSEGRLLVLRAPATTPQLASVARPTIPNARLCRARSRSSRLHQRSLRADTPPILVDALLARKEIAPWEGPGSRASGPLTPITQQRARRLGGDAVRPSGSPADCKRPHLARRRFRAGRFDRSCPEFRH
jgi:hypothetical protein